MTVTVREVAPPPPKVPSPPAEGRGPGGPPPAPQVARRVGVWLLVGAVTIFFLALTSALLARQAGLDWGRIPPPRILWFSTAAIVASSALLEAARTALRRDRCAGFRRRLEGSALLGAGFLAAQITAWRALVHQGVYLVTHPHASYFYLLTGAHAAHLLGGLIWFGRLVRTSRRGAVDPERIADFAVYWHFLAGLWVYLVAVLFL